VVSCDLPEATDLEALARRVSSILAPAVAIRSAQWAEPEFDARYSAAWRHYRYTVLNTPRPSPFLAPTAWHVAPPLDVLAMRLGCDPLIGEHDFTSFCRKPKLADGSEPVLVRRVREAAWTDLGDGVLRFEIRANAFCHQMVRSVVGLLVEAGMGVRHAGDISAVIRAKDRAAAGRLAPPQGLMLWHVDLGDSTPAGWPGE
jgi:tRNA pseudouridine38-40 synthase